MIKDKVTVNGHVWRCWTVNLEASHVNLSEHIKHVEYMLHESFRSPPIVCNEPPYQIQREGWGEFDLRISLHLKDPLVPSPQTFLFDLNFQKPKYSKFKKVVLGTDTEYKQEDSEFDEEDLHRRHSPNKRRNANSGKNSKMIYKRQRSSSSVTSLIVKATPADNNNKDLQQNQQQPQAKRILHPQKKQEQHRQPHLHQHKQNAACRSSPHYILNQGNDLNLVLESKTIDLAELKALLEALDEYNLRKVYTIMMKYDTSAMDIKETNDGYYLIDINSASADLINKLWEFVIDVEIEKCREGSTLSENINQQHQQHTSYL
ncbi:yeats family-domain-containing protein [Parasitella parasitica]|nr:yeats family-domain-containing protein [Parasitella parasitica]